ncbi:hypothetical protein LZ554_002612 [Drepanopeziza brunnea f. sp. 'monogermtubi']|nr:hypothetical protein LZ554_002612 [Drepanopeziza brunnea f. sp. 'monogermtubi']
MKAIDVVLLPILPSVVLLHLLVAPYTKVEESFNIQATHDILKYGAPYPGTDNAFLQQKFDHVSFPGAVPRTSIGARTLAALSSPIIPYVGQQYVQFAVRAVLGFYNAAAMYKYSSGLSTAFGGNVGRWYIVLQASQFHVMFYASRTLPNMFAFGLTTFAFAAFLPSPSRTLQQEQRKQKFGIMLFVLAGIIFRSEVALLLASQLLFLLVQSKISLKTIIAQGFMAAFVGLTATVLLDSVFWQKTRPFWPELEGFYFNAIQGKSSDWGTSPLPYYFTNSLPRLLLNPMIFILIPAAFALPSTRYHTQGLVIPSLLFISIFSLQPHKESRFIIYAVPPLTAAASLSASYIWTRRKKSWIYSLGSFLLAGSVAASFLASTTMLLISSLNYPGGDALAQLHDYIHRQTLSPAGPNGPSNTTLNIHMDVLSCMTGVTRFQQRSDIDHVHLTYDKTENDTQLLEPGFWASFDYALMEEPGKAIGKWEVVGTVFAYAGIEFLKPGDGSSFGESLERVYAANNLTRAEGDEVMSSEEVIEEVNSHKGEAEKVGWDEEKAREIRELEDLKARLMLEEMGRFGTFKLVRDAVRLVTGGYWIGPRMEPRIRILKRVKD